MRASFLSAIVAVTTLSYSALAVKGVIKDEITTDEQGCRSLCGLNNDCFAILYDSNCHECWQLDCHPDNQPVDGLKATGKATDLPAPKCDGVKFPTKPTVCKKASDAGASTAGTSASPDATASTGTSSGSSATPSETSADDKKNDGWRGGASWVSVVGVVAVAALVTL